MSNERLKALEDVMAMMAARATRQELLEYLVAEHAAAKAQPAPTVQEPFGYLSQHTTPGPFEWQFSKTFAGVYRDTAKSITAVYTTPPAQPAPVQPAPEKGKL